MIRYLLTLWMLLAPPALVRAQGVAEIRQPVLESAVAIEMQCPGGVCPRPRPPHVADPTDDPSKLPVTCWDASLRVERVAGNARFYGSGTVIGADNGNYLVLTNQHVAPSEGTYRVRFRSGKEYAASWLMVDGQADLGAVTFKADEKIPAIPIADDAAVGQLAVKIGYPLGKGPDGRSGYLTNGIQTPNVACTIPVQQGDSGSGLFRVRDGKLMAVIWGSGYASSVAVCNADVNRFTALCFKRWRRTAPADPATPMQPTVPSVPPAPTAPSSDAAIAALQGAVASLQSEIKSLKIQTAVPGPQGPAGKDGAPGKDGAAGHAGVAGKDGKAPDLTELTAAMADLKKQIAALQTSPGAKPQRVRIVPATP